MMIQEWIGKVVEVVMDRPQGTKHPHFGFKYPVNYGFLPGTLAPDGEEIDAYVLGVTRPLKRFTGRVIAVMHRHDDDDDKLVVVPDGLTLTDEQIERRRSFRNSFLSR